MKRNSPNRYLAAGSLILLTAALPASADLFWDGTNTSPDADGGAGVWDTSALNWDSAATAGTDSAWVNTQIAVFGGTGGTVSVAPSGITAAGLKLTATGYTITDSVLTLGAGAINVDPGVEATVASTLASGLTKTGTGTLVLNGTNSYTAATVVSAGTLKVGAAAPSAFRYYRFNTLAKNNPGDGYNQIGELHYYKAGVWTAATAGTPGTSGETWWANANDNKGTAATFTKFGIGTIPWALNYDFGTAQNFDSYNWSTGNDSTPARNPARWQVLGSVDNTNFTLLDDRTNLYSAGPTATYTWAGTNSGTYAAVDNSPNGGATDSYPIPYSTRTSMPTGSPLQLAAGATFDLNGRGQTLASLADSAGGGGSVLSSVAATPVTLEIGNTGTTSTTFSGVISDGPSGSLSLVKGMASAQVLSGTLPNTYTGTTIIAGQGKLVLAKSDGVNAVPGNVSIASHTFAGNASGLVLGANEQIPDSATITFPENSYGGGTMGDSYFRLNGKTETIRGLVATRATGIGAPGNFAVVENRGLNDTVTTYAAGKVIIKTQSGDNFVFLGSLRNFDGGSGGNTVSIVKTGPGMQTLGGQMSGATGASEVNDGTLRVTNPITTPATVFSWGAPVLVTGTGTLDGNGSITGAISVTGGGTFIPGLLGAPFTAAGGTTASGGGTLSFSGGSLAGAATIGTGGNLTGAGTITGALTTQAGSTTTVGGASIGTLTASSTVSLGGTLNMQVDKTGGVVTSDAIGGFTGITYGGTLALSFTGEAFALGDSIQLFSPASGGTFTGNFTSITGLPSLPAGALWDTTSLKVDGKIKVGSTANTPVLAPAPVITGSIGAQSVTITADPGATIYYTLDGSDPTISSSSGASPLSGIIIPTDSVTTLKAYATLSGYTDSAIVTGVYRTATTPKWNVDAAGNWGDAVNWFNNVIPNASGVTADFTLAQTAARTVTVNANETVGLLKFANANAFAWTLASSSTLTLATPTGTPEINVADIATVDPDATISAPVAGTQGFTKTGAGVLALTGAKAYTGTIAINGGKVSTDSLVANGTNSPLGAGSTITMDGGTLRYTGTGSVGFGTFNRLITLNAGGGTIDGGTPTGFWFISGAISGPGSLTKVGARQLIIQSPNTYDGQTFINEGEVQIRTTDALGSTVGNTVVASGMRLAFGQGFPATPCPENLVLNGMGNTNAGALQVNDGGITPTVSGTVTLGTGDTGIGCTASPLTLTGAVGGAGNLIKVGTNTLTLGGSGANNYTGSTTLAGTGKLLLAKTGGVLAIPGDITLASTGIVSANNSGLVLGGDEQIANGAVLTWATTAFGGGAQADCYFRLNGHLETIGGLVSTGNGAKVAIENRGNGDAGTYVNGTLVINTATATSYSFNGNIRNVDGGAGSGGLVAITKIGTGTQTFTGTLMSYSGATLVNGGTLVLNNTGGASPITVNNTATLKGTGSTTNTLTVVSGGTVAPGVGVGTYTAGPTSIAGTYACEVDGATADRLTVTADLTLTGTSTLAFTTLNAPTLDSYIIGSYGSTITGSFATVTGLPTGYEIYVDTTAKTILLRKATGFTGWATSNGLSGNPSADFDGDGLADGIEYVLGTTPTSNSAASAPVAAVVGPNLVFTFNRDHAHMTPDTTVSVQVSTLNPPVWTNYSVGATTVTSSPGITVTDNGSYDTVTLIVPAVGAFTKFARLVVDVNLAP